MLLSDKNDKRLSEVVVIVVFSLFLTNIAFLLQSTTGVNQTLVSDACKGCIFVSLLLCWRIYFIEFNHFCLKFLYAAFVLIFINLLFFGNNVYFDQTLIRFFTLVFPMVFVFSMIKDYGIVLKLLRKASLVIAGFLLIAVLTGILRTSYDTVRYSMGFASSLVLPTIILLEQLLNDNPPFKLRIILSSAIICNLFSIAAFGSRGALLAIIFFTLFVVFRQLGVKKNGFFLIVSVFLITCALFSNYILAFLLEFLTNHGYQSRTLKLFLFEASHDSGRLYIWSQLLQAIIDQPFEIRGINSDYLLLGGYSHNYFLELFHAFGILIGGLCTTLITVNIIKTLRKGFNNDASRLELLLLFSFFPVCLWSGSIWTSTYFWSWVAVLNMGNYNKRLLKRR